MKRRIVVVGAAGRLGSALVEAFTDWDVVTCTRATLDVTDADAVRRTITDAAPAVVANCVAFNLVDEAERRPQEALAINAIAVRTLSRAADGVGAMFVHYGSDFVFDGRAQTPYGEDIPPHPLSTYAMSKLLGDWFGLDAERGYVLRVESLFGGAAGWSGRAGSLDAIVDGLSNRRTVKAFTDRIVSPTFVPDAARATRHLIETEARPGLYHCVNSGHATWYEVAEECARLLGVHPQLEAVTLETHQLRAARPRFCALSNAKLADAGYHMPAWRDALARWIEGRRQRVSTIQ